MKKGIFVALAALALTVFAVPDAHAWKGHHHGPDVDQRLFVQIITVDVDLDADGNEDPTGNTTGVASGIAKGQPGRADVSAVLVFKTLFVEDDRCPDELPLGADVVRFEWGQVYSDGSLLSGFADADQAFCTNGTLTSAELTGPISGGTGRFEGRTGKWSTVASSPTTNTNTTGTFTVVFD
ncbi:MAG: hypothetical protein WBB42_09110 [Polyangiales bacterium]